METKYHKRGGDRAEEEVVNMRNNVIQCHFKTNTFSHIRTCDVYCSARDIIIDLRLSFGYSAINESALVLSCGSAYS